MRLGRATATVGGLTALSRVAGFGRDLLIAAALGAGPVADAFFVSLKLANFLRRLFAEGAFAAAFVPLFIRLRAADGDAAARGLAGDALAVLALVLAAVVLAGEWLMPLLVRVLATGFAPGSPRYELAVDLGRITFPYLFLISLAALFAGILQAGQRFAAAAFAPVLLNLVLIAALLATGADGVAAARALAWGMPVAGVLQLALVAAACWRAGLAPRLRRPALTPGVRRLGRLMGPGLLGIGVVQVNLLVASWFASHLAAGAVSFLFYADRLVQLPLGVVGVALGTALLPALAAAGRSSDRPPAGVLNRALELGLLLGLPAAVGLGLLAHPIVTVLFERGAFGPEASRATAEVLAGLAIGLPAQVVAKVLAPAFFAREDTATPVRVAMAALGVNLGASLLLVPALGHVGLALALSLSSWANALGLAWLLASDGGLAPDPLLRRRALALLVSVLAMAGVLRAMAHLLVVPDALRLAAVIGAAGAAFLLAAWATGAADVGYWRRASRA
jgi:putative peptidoglycan lipid II flippase